MKADCRKSVVYRKETPFTVHESLQKYTNKLLSMHYLQGAECYFLCMKITKPPYDFIPANKLFLSVQSVLA